MIGLVAGCLGAGFVAGWALTGAARRYALTRAIFDTPNERSSHKHPVPLGGGWGIATPALAAVAMAWSAGLLDRAAAMGLLGGGAAVAIVGWIDDRVRLSARVRLLVQVAAAAWLVGWLGGYDSLDAGTARINLGAITNAIVVLTIVWCTNLYNFMDGIDGIAGMEAVFVGLAGGVFLLASGAIGLAVVALVVAAASGGFLVWNRSPARIFMGDAGAGLLGFLLAGLAACSEVERAVPALIWAVLLGTFIADATIVLCRRIARGERWYSAHRGHLYQRLVQSGWTHGQVDGVVAIINVVLVGLAAAAWRWRGALPMALGVATLGLLVLYRAGDRYLARAGGDVTPAAPPAA
ncbi:MAG TPA: glycosyltransferase family 4 protein [Gemmatimonadales bacterium]